ncbi:hypothetical protein PsorP6_016478 [Peronosclerospora sorghi]|uniref:Uncharacterized protein n=1 Tax=Peronosclerospora sorghi TaxID=230839 RepID=A0ACC0VQD1_9STRA|nr:hypothetical protein PsorP6_016478 [Peronosclerospora sorghi]
MNVLAIDQYMTLSVDTASLATHECTIDYSNDAKKSNENPLISKVSMVPGCRDRHSTGSFVGMGLGGLMFTIATNQVASYEEIQRCSSTLTPTTIDSFEGVLHEQTGLGCDDVITANRIPRDKKVIRERLI